MDQTTIKKLKNLLFNFNLLSKHKILTLPFLMAGLILNAQEVEIKGVIVEEQSKIPLEFAEVTLWDKNSSEILYGVTTELEGDFILNPKEGIYTLKVHYIGQVLYETTVDVKDVNIDLGTIEVVNSFELDEVTLVSRRKLIQRKVDRLVFNVENSMQSSKGNALDVLKVTPGVKVLNDKVSMLGKNKISLMLNDKIISLSKDELSNFLKSIPSEDIKSIEVITAPPAKYEADGNSGMINIQLKKTKADSWNTLLKAGYNKREFGSKDFLVNFNYNKNKFSFSTSLSSNYETYYQDQNEDTYYATEYWVTKSPIRADYERFNSRVDASYDLSQKWVMGFQYMGSFTDTEMSDSPITEIIDNATNTRSSSLESTGEIFQKPIFNSINYYNQIKLDTAGRGIDLNFDYFKYENLDTRTYTGTRNIGDVVDKYFFGTNGNNQVISNFSIKLDLTWPTSFANFNFGAKSSFSDANNSIMLFNSGLIDTPVVEYSTESSNFEYLETIYSVYASGSKQLSDKVELQAGLRMESTGTESVSTTTALNNTNSYTRLFPSLFLNYAASENLTLSGTYNRRISRPQFYSLNPNGHFINPFISVIGNPFLQPSFVDNFEFGYSYRNFVGKVFYSDEKDIFEQVPIADGSTQILTFQNENYINTKRVGVSLYYSYDELSWWECSNSVDVIYNKSSFNLEGFPNLQDTDGINTSFSTDNNFNLNKDRTLIANLYFWYSPPGIDGIFEVESTSSLSLSIHKLFLDKNLRIALSAEDIFRGQKYRYRTSINNIPQNSEYFYDTQAFKVSISYKFGNKDLSTKTWSSGNSEEKNRVIE